MLVDGFGINPRSRTSALAAQTQIALLFLTIVLGFSVRVYRASSAPHVRGDAVEYRTLAYNLLDGHGFSLSRQAPYLPTDWRTPVYPAFVASVFALTSRSNYAVMIIQAIMDSATAVVIFLIGKTVFNARIGLVAALLVALNWPMIALSASLYSTTLYTLLITLALLITVSSRVSDRSRTTYTKACAIGALLGLATLTRPTTIVFPLFLFPALYIATSRRHAIVVTSVTMIVMSVLVAPWIIRNYRVLGRTELADSALLHATMRIGIEPEMNYEMFGEIVERAQPGLMTNEERQAYAKVVRSEYISFVRARPLTYLKRKLSHLYHLWVPGLLWALPQEYSMPFLETLQPGKFHIFAARTSGMMVFGLLPLGLCAAAIPMGVARNRYALTLLAFPIFATVVFLPLTVASYYTVPALPGLSLFVALFLVVGLPRMWAMVRNRHIRVPV